MAHSNHPGGEKHHYIPKFYMKQWAGEDDGCVSEFSRPYHPKPNVPAPLKPLMKVRRVNPDATGYLRGLNPFASLRPELADFLEHQFFKQTDGGAAQVLNRLLRCDLEFDGQTKNA
jgi:hypothetical protein